MLIVKFNAYFFFFHFVAKHTQLLYRSYFALVGHILLALGMFINRYELNRRGV